MLPSIRELSDRSILKYNIRFGGRGPIWGYVVHFRRPKMPPKLVRKFWNSGFLGRHTSLSDSPLGIAIGPKSRKGRHFACKNPGLPWFFWKAIHICLFLSGYASFMYPTSFLNSTAAALRTENSGDKSQKRDQIRKSQLFWFHPPIYSDALICLMHFREFSFGI